jgi:hypothetical protein
MPAYASFEKVGYQGGAEGIEAEEKVYYCGDPKLHQVEDEPCHHPISSSTQDDGKKIMRNGGTIMHGMVKQSRDEKIWKSNYAEW